MKGMAMTASISAVAGDQDRKSGGKGPAENSEADKKLTEVTRAEQSPGPGGLADPRYLGPGPADPEADIGPLLPVETPPGPAEGTKKKKSSARSAQGGMDDPTFLMPGPDDPGK